MVDEKIVERRVRQRNEALKNLGNGANEDNTESSASRSKSRRAYSTYSLNRLYTLIQNASENNSTATHYALHTGEREIEGGKLKVFIKKALRKLLRTFFGWYILPIHERQTVYNEQTNVAIANLLKACEWQRRMLSELNRRTESMAEELNEKDAKIEALSTELLKNEEKIMQLYEQLEDLREIRSERISSHSVSSSMTEEQSKYFNYLMSKLNVSYDPQLIEDGVMDYFKFEDTFRGSEELIKERQKQYLPYLKTDYSDGYVLELGFGRGELLSLMEENGIAAAGVDSYAPFVKYCFDKGYKVSKGDALTYLSECADNSLNGIALCQVAEHVNTDYLYQLIRTGYKKLRKGCYFIIETPNAETLSTYTDFFIDGTHVKPVSYYALSFVFKENGYSEITRLENGYSYHPYGEEMQKLIIDKCSDEKEKEFYLKIKSMMFGARDFTIIARK